MNERIFFSFIFFSSSKNNVDKKLLCISHVFLQFFFPISLSCACPTRSKNCYKIILETEREKHFQLASRGSCKPNARDVSFIITHRVRKKFIFPFTFNIIFPSVFLRSSFRTVRFFISVLAYIEKQDFNSYIKVIYQSIEASE